MVDSTAKTNTARSQLVRASVLRIQRSLKRNQTQSRQSHARFTIRASDLKVNLKVYFSTDVLKGTFDVKQSMLLYKRLWNYWRTRERFGNIRLSARTALLVPPNSCFFISRKKHRTYRIIKICKQRIVFSFLSLADAESSRTQKTPW